MTVLLNMLQQETDPHVLNSIGVAFGHLDDPRAIGPLTRLKNHPHEDVRFGVVLGLLGHEKQEAIQALIELSSDPDRDVRNWATFGIANHIEMETPELLALLDTSAIREALLARATEDDPEIRGEALIGLAVRKDERVIDLLRRELEGEFFGIWAVEAAGILGDPAFFPVVKALWERLDPREKQKGWFERQFQETLEACKPREL